MQEEYEIPQSLKDAAMDAEEIFGLDELEEYARLWREKELKKKRAKEFIFWNGEIQ